MVAFEDSIQIEMDYIERAAKRSEDKESIDENNDIWGKVYHVFKFVVQFIV